MMLLLVASFVVTAWALIDVIKTPSVSFVAVGPKALWMALLAAGLLFAMIPGGLIGIVYLAVVRPRLVHSL